ncbi:hypothetical protein GH714_014318 [Hevea brasiliensis]|uniref:Protein kinase domain-containing protein n=1 Tax=Hevea brasiliensis TaxID=3981 RepID=A0A6A6N1Q3_HEVBR|nr:hypothetical protein GH714_014318 [Hevea brasiliensis]
MVRKNAESARKEAEKVEKVLQWPLIRTKEANMLLNGLLITFSPEANLSLFSMLNKGRHHLSMPHYLHSMSLSFGIQKNLIFLFPLPFGAAVGANVNEDVSRTHTKQLESEARELFLPFRCFCTRKDIRCKEVVVEDVDVSKAIIDYAASHIIETLILGATTRGGLIVRSPFIRNSGSMGKSYNHYPPEMDVSYASSVRPTSKRMFPSFHDHSESVMSPQYAMGNDYDDRSFGSMYSASTSIDMDSQYNYSCSSQDTGQRHGIHTTWRLRLELKQTMDMYNSACREALSAKQKTREYQYQNLKEHRFDEAQIAEEAALALVEKEKAKCNAAIEAAQAAQKLAEMEAQKRMSLEMKALKDSEETKARESWVPSDLRYRRYTIEEIETATKDFSDSLKIGEGGYGPVYRCYLDHTEVAVKVLRADAAQGKSQFQQEVEVLSCIRHPNMVLLLGACPEYGCLVYEHMANGSLDDRLFRRGNTPPLPWQVRFRIAAEIATGLLFLHQTKPEPLVHRDLKPGNILLDRNFVSKISDVGLARLVPHL